MTSSVKTPVPARERLIVALDVPEAAAARSLVRQIGDAAGLYKVGLQLFTAEGPAVIRELVNSGHQVFLDLKLHDIPNTVASAVRAAGKLRVSMLTVHASGGINMLRAAKDAAPSGLKVLAVTVLTSLKDEDLQEIGIAGGVTDQVLRAAVLARQAGCDGVVASAKESALLRRELGEGFIIVNPGVRPAGAETNDQQRVATPAEAIAAGASHIVVGRPVTQSADPAGAARAIIAEMEHAQVLR